MAIEVPNLNLAQASIVSGVGPTFLYNRGFASVVRNGAGDYTLTLESGGVDAAQCNIQCTSRGAVGLIFAVVHTSDTAKQILETSNAGAATDGDFDVTVTQPISGS